MPVPSKFKVPTRADFEWDLGGVGRIHRPVPAPPKEAEPALDSGPPGWRKAFGKYGPSNYAPQPRNAPHDRWIENQPSGRADAASPIAGIEPGRAQYGPRLLDRRVHRMPPPWFPNQVRSSLGGTGLLARLNPVGPGMGGGWRRGIRQVLTPRNWGMETGLKRFYWGAEDPRSAPLVGRRVRVAQQQMRPQLRWKFALPYFRPQATYPVLGE